MTTNGANVQGNVVRYKDEHANCSIALRDAKTTQWPLGWVSGRGMLSVIDVQPILRNAKSTTHAAQKPVTFLQFGAHNVRLFPALRLNMNEFVTTCCRFQSHDIFSWTVLNIELHETGVGPRDNLGILPSTPGEIEFAILCPHMIPWKCHLNAGWMKDAMAQGNRGMQRDDLELFKVGCT